MIPAEPHPLTDSTNAMILMHRDTHFGGSFPVMLEYYHSEGIGCSPEFTLSQIEALAEMEKKVGENLAPIHLTGPDAEKVARARKAYKDLKELYEVQNPETTVPLLVADLILSEEIDPVNEIEQIVAQKRAAIPALLDLIRSEDFHDPLFPGYGRAPELAVRCLGLIGNESAIATLFEAIHENEFFEEDTSIQALKLIGEPAKQFLLKVLKAKPFNLDNERAAITLVQFEDDPEVAKACFEILQEIDCNQHLPLAVYLALGCSALQDPKDRESFIAMSESKETPSMLKQDMKTIRKNWK